MLKGNLHQMKLYSDNAIRIVLESKGNCTKSLVYPMTMIAFVLYTLDESFEEAEALLLQAIQVGITACGSKS